MGSAADRAANKWDVSTPVGYRPDAYYTQASDKKGHSAKFTVKVPTPIAGEIDVLVQSGKIPDLRTVQDFLRDAIVHRLHQLQPYIDDPELERKITMWTIYQDAQRKEAERLEYSAMMESIQKEIVYLQTQGQIKALRIYLNDLLDKADIAIPEAMRADFVSDIRIRLRTLPQS